MIIDAVIRRYGTDPNLLKRRGPGKGNPTASQAGACAAQLQMLRFPAWTHPEIRSIRSAWVFEDGDRHAAWLKAQIEEVFPGMSGLSEELFYFPVPVTPEQEQALARKIADRSLWGTISSGFIPPRITLGRDGQKDRMRLVDRDPLNPERPRPMGFVVEPGTGILWAPLYIDHVLRHPGLGRLVVIEFKSMSRFSFRRALLGEMGYKERVQLAVIAEATSLDTVWLVKAKDTAHLLEIAFLSDQDGTRVTLLRSNGVEEVYWVKDGLAVPEAGGRPVELRESEDWDVGEVWTPRDPALLAHARARILKVLLFQPSDDPEVRLRQWDREYGPNFQCETCQGTGLQTLQKGKSEPLKKSKPCVDCNQTGQLEEVELPAFPCGYSIPVDTPILRADYTWVPAAKLAPGDALIGFEEVTRPRLHGRKIVPTMVEAVAPRFKDTIGLATSRGPITCSPEHPWLVRMGEKPVVASRRREGIGWQDAPHWRRADAIVPGMQVYYFCDPTEAVAETEAYMGGYIRGLVEGDGTVQRADTTPYVRVAMTDGSALDRLVSYLTHLGIQSTRKPWGKWAPGPTSFVSRKPIEAVWFGGRSGAPATSRLLSWPLDTRDAAAGYLGGLYDAEGSLTEWSLRIFQRDDSPVIPRALASASLLRFDLRLEPWRKGDHGAALRLYTQSLLSDLVRFFTITRPAIARKTALLGRSLYNSWATVLAVEPGPEMPMIDLQTSSQTFVAAGFASHNCPVVTSACWPMARKEVTDKPRWFIRRADVEAKGLTFTPPEILPTGSPILPPEPTASEA